MNDKTKVICYVIHRKYQRHIIFSHPKRTECVVIPEGDQIHFMRAHLRKTKLVFHACFCAAIKR